MVVLLLLRGTTNRRDWYDTLNQLGPYLLSFLGQHTTVQEASQAFSSEGEMLRWGEGLFAHMDRVVKGASVLSLDVRAEW